MPRDDAGVSCSAEATRSGITTPATPDSISAALLTRPRFTNSYSDAAILVVAPTETREGLETHTGTISRDLLRPRPCANCPKMCAGPDWLPSTGIADMFSSDMELTHDDLQHHASRRSRSSRLDTADP